MLIHSRKPLVKFFGSKWTLVKRREYPLPIYKCIIEPFCGGANYSMFHLQSGYKGKVILNDIDPRICMLWSWLKKAKKEDILSLPVNLKPGTDITSLGLEPGATELIIKWQRVGINKCVTVSKWNNLGGQWSESVKERIAESLQYLRNIEVLNLDYHQLPDLKGTWFIDPPYENNTVSYTKIIVEMKSII